MNRRINLTLARAGLGLSLALLGGAASAHPGHGPADLQAGLAHPLGLDHLLAMVAVGLWSASALPARRALLGPLCFVLALLAGAGFGMAGWQIGGLESLIATSVVLFGVLVAGARRWSVGTGMGLILVSGLVHGLAHGAELPMGASALAYVGGFAFSTMVLHAAGLLAGVLMSRLGGGQDKALRLSGGLLGAAGLLMLAGV